MNDPVRLLDDPQTSDELRFALEAGRSERPTAAELASLAATLGPLLLPGGPGSGPGSGPGPGPGAGAGS